MKPRVLIAAGGQRAAFLANLLHDKGYPVSLIARSRQEAENLPTEKGVDVFYGNPAKPYVLEQAGADQAGMIAAMSESVCWRKNASGSPGPFPCWQMNRKRCSSAGPAWIRPYVPPP